MPKKPEKKPLLKLNPLSDLKQKRPFCPLCFRYLNPAELRKHDKHRGVIIYKK